MLTPEDLFRHEYILVKKENTIKEEFINTLVQIYFSDWIEKARDFKQ